MIADIARTRWTRQRCLDRVDTCFLQVELKLVRKTRYVSEPEQYTCTRNITQNTNKIGKTDVTAIKCRSFISKSSKNHDTRYTHREELRNFSIHGGSENIFVIWRPTIECYSKDKKYHFGMNKVIFDPC